MATERQANCKECGNVYSYSVEWAEFLSAQGQSPPEYCPRCRAIHALERRSVAMPYYKAVPTGPRKPDDELSPGRLGRLTHFDRDHRSVSIEAKFHTPDSDIDFGIKDGDILELIDILVRHQVTVVVGPTGSGKSTFLPYRLMVPPAPADPDLFTRYGQIVVTQPRIQATRSIPAFVARDLHGCTLGAGSDVGYVHGGERAADRQSKLIYCTDGTLINWIASGRVGDFSVIVIDEAHERSLNIDVILGLLRIRLPLYPDLRLIIASATIDANLFIQHFSAIGEVGFKDFRGLKRFDYQVCHPPKPVSGKKPRLDDMVAAAANQTIQLLSEIALGERKSFERADNIEAAPEGDILVFMPTVSSLEKTVATIRARLQDDPLLSGQDVQVYPLHRRLPLEVQDLALQKKSKAIAERVRQALLAIADGQASDGDLLALILDTKSAAEAVSKITEVVTNTPEFAGTAVGLSLADAVAPGWSDSPRRTVIVTTHDQARDLNQTTFRQVICDRRVVVSTNVAETSLTVDGVVYVVDSGLILRPEWNRETLTTRFQTFWHSQDGCKQRWGRAGRVRDGYAYALYTKTQYDQFDAHTIPEIQRAPLEAVVITAKRAGVDDIVGFPWIQRPDDEELHRAIQAVRQRGFVDADGDLTEHGQMVGQFRTAPDAGHLLVLADQFACAIETATLIPMINLRLRGGLLRWHHQWDGHTRRAVRLIQEGLMAGCHDDIAFLLKVFHSWFEAWRPEFNWLTDEPFKRIWPDRIPKPTDETTRALGEAVIADLIQGLKASESESDLRRLVASQEPNPMLESWINAATTAMRDARRAAWAQRFFVDHAVLASVAAQRQEILEQLSIGKKEVEARPLELDRLLHRVRLVMAYAWSDQVYATNGHCYLAVSPRTRELEKEFTVEIGHDSILSSRTRLPKAFVSGKRAVGRKWTPGEKPQTMLYVSFLAAIDTEWLPALTLKPLELAHWAALNLRPAEDVGQMGEGFLALVDQHYPLWGIYGCTTMGNVGEKAQVAVGERLLPPPLIEEMTPEGEIIWSEGSADGVDIDLDERAGVDPDVRATLDPESEDPLDGLEVDESAVVNDVAVQLLHAVPGLGPVSAFLRETQVAEEIPSMGNSGDFLVPEGRHRLAFIECNPEKDTNQPIIEQDLWLDGDRPCSILLAGDPHGGLRILQIPGQSQAPKSQKAFVRLVHAAVGVCRLRLIVGTHATPQAVPFLDRTPFLEIPAGRECARVESEDGAILFESEMQFEQDLVYSIAVALSPDDQLATMVWLDAGTTPYSQLPSPLRGTAERIRSLPGPRVVGRLCDGNVDGSEDPLEAEVVGYEMLGEGTPCLRLRETLEPRRFERFVHCYQVGDPVPVQATELEQGTEDEQVALVVEVQDLGLEVVMEPTDLTFAGRTASVRTVAPGMRFLAVVEEIVPRTRRVYLSCLPLLEQHLPGPGSVLEGIVSETGQRGAHIQLLAPPTDLPLPLSAYAAAPHIPQSIMHHGQGDRVVMRVDYEQSHEKKLRTISPALEELLQETYWHNRVVWNSVKRQLQVQGRLTHADRLLLSAQAEKPRCRRAINELYRLSNQLRAHVAMDKQIETFAAHVKPGAKVSARVIKVRKHDALLRLADGVRAKAGLRDLQQATGGTVRLDQEIDVSIEAVDPTSPFVDVRLPTRAELLRERYAPGSVHKGHLTRLEQYGVFVELEPFVKGLIQTRDLLWHRGSQLADIVRDGDTLDVEIIRVRDDGKIDLRLALTAEELRTRYPPQGVFRGRVARVRRWQAVVELEPLIAGVLQGEHLSWCKVKHAADILQVDDTVDVRILAVHADGRIDLSLRRDDNDPKDKYPSDSQAQGQVLKLLPYGALVQFEPNVVGLIHIAELAWKRIEKPAEVVSPGQQLTVRILNVHGDPRKLDLSLKRAFRAHLCIPRSQIGLLIGRRGQTVRNIKQETDTEIRVNQEGTVTIWGSKLSKVDNAIACVYDLVPDAEPC